MKVTIITQDDPFYLARNLDYLIRNFPSHSKIVSCVVLGVSPFGKKETFAKKMLKTYRIFGLMFFLRYALKFLLCKLKKKNNVKWMLNSHGIPIIELEKGINSADSLETLKSFQPDLLVSIAGNQIFKKPLLELCPKGCLNLHTALLPKYRGLMPSFWVLKNGEKDTGVSVFFVDEGIDSGPIVVQKQVPIGNKTLEELIEHTKKVGMDAIIEAVDRIEKNEVDLLENDSSKMTYFSFPTRKDVREFLEVGKRFF